MNATKPGDMKSEIAREILNDLVHVRKRMSRLIQTQKINDPNARKRIIDLNDRINDSLILYKERYNELKEDYRLGVKSEALTQKESSPSKESKKEEPNEESKNNEDKNKIKKGLAGSKLAPPSGWKAP
mmetsp:Transcript_4964/g.4166  ORF Transcript_4964/g.4166 Transcript_4964/m.4166 type:complete len:128 (-) Transcript_4964:657-1040(-)